MRADRLISILMLLQRRGKIPARELAGILGVSQRTIYRDIEALSIAGIPVYTERGAEGGCLLVENYRSDLTGLTNEEWGALLLVNAPSPLDDLGIGDKIRSAFRKLMAATSNQIHGSSNSAPEIFLDWTAWNRQTQTTEPLGSLFQSARNGCKVRFCYRWREDIQIELVVGILGLVAKASDWYLVCSVNEKIRTFRIADLQDVRAVDEPFTPPSAFQLEKYWKNLCSDRESYLSGYEVRIRTTAHFAGYLKRRFAHRIQEVEMDAVPSNNEKISWSSYLRISFESFEAAREQLLAHGGALEVLDPIPLRLVMMDYAQQMLKVYNETK